MQPNRIGRVLGIGTRVAGKKLREQADRLGSAPQPAEPGAGTVEAPDLHPTEPKAGSRGAPAPAEEIAARMGAGVRQAAQNFRVPARVRNGQAAAGSRNAGSASVADRASAGTRRLSQGAGRFGAAFFRPFAHATSLLSHQISGIFFALFAVFFIEHTWIVYRTAQWRDRHLFLYGGLALAFLWFAASTFWRVRRKQRRG